MEKYKKQQLLLHIKNYILIEFDIKVKIKDISIKDSNIILNIEVKK